MKPLPTILFIFILSFTSSLIFVPLARILGERYGAVDFPNKRKVHACPIPRSGGIGLILAFTIGIIGGKLLPTQLASQLVMNEQLFALMIGAMIIVGVGIYDDFYHLGAQIKFIYQIFGATIVYLGGIKVFSGNFLAMSWMGSIASYLLTIFWFLLIINAINFIDGVDGLAGGICLFVFIIMGILSIIRQEYILSIYFTAMTGATLGFLRYNFIPATVFLGDGGSYFLGYTIAGFSCIGAVENQTSSTLLIPIVALGVPLLDTLLSPIRRWLRAKNIFCPDKGHIHHKLMSKGYPAHKVVEFLYLITLGLCLGLLVLVNLENEFTGLILVVLGTAAFLVFQKSGYLEYLDLNQLRSWFRDIYDSTGLSLERRTFLNIQIEMSKVKTVDELWKEACFAFSILQIDYAEMFCFKAQSRKDRFTENYYNWKAPDFDNSCLSCSSLFKIEMPLLTKSMLDLGNLWIAINLEGKDPSPYMMRRIEQLRILIIKNLKRIKYGQE